MAMKQQKRLRTHATQRTKPSSVFYSRWRRRVQSILLSREQMTRGEFIRFFLIPFFFSLTLFFFLLFFISRSSFSITLPKTVLPQQTILSKIIESPRQLVGGKAVLDGSEIYDPYMVKVFLDKGSLPFLLVDVRSSEEYEMGHIRGAMNLPLYKKTADIVSLQIREKDVLQQLSKFGGKHSAIVIYAHTRDSKIAQDLVLLLKKNRREVSRLGVGWNEWRHFRNIWVPEAEWENFDITRYVEEHE